MKNPTQEELIGLMERATSMGDTSSANEFASMINGSSNPPMEVIIRPPQNRSSNGNEGSDLGVTPPVAFNHRAGVNLKITDQGKQGYLESIYGKDNVFVSDTLGSRVRQGPNHAWVDVDPSGIDIGDVADLSDEALEIGAPIMAGTNPLTAMAYAAGGSSARQALSASLPGEDNLSLTDRALHVGLNTAFAGGGTYLGNGLSTGIKHLNPSRVVGRGLNKSANTPYAQEGAILADDVGPLTFGQETGNKAVRMVEGVAAQHPASANTAQAFQARQIGALKDRFTQVVERFFNPNRTGATVGPPVKVDASAVGNSVSQAYVNTVDRAVKYRSQRGTAAFGAVDRVANTVTSDGKAVFSVNNAIKTVDDLIDEFSTPGAGDQAAVIVRRLKVIKNQWSKNGASVTSSEMGNLLSQYSKMTVGRGGLFINIEKSEQRAIARRLMQGLEADLEAAVKTNVNGPAATALRRARDTWRADSKAINELEQSALGGLFGGRSPKSGAEVITAFEGMTPGQLTEATKLLDEVSPQIMNDVRGVYLQRLFNRSGGPVTNGNPAGVLLDERSIVREQLSPASIYNNARGLGGKNETADNMLKALFPKLTDRNQIGAIVEYARRVSNTAGMAGSQTGPFLETMAILKGTLFGGPVSWVKTGVSVVAPTKAWNLMTTAQGRQALMRVMKTASGEIKAGPKEVTALRFVQQSLGHEFVNEPMVQGLRPARQVPNRLS